MTPSPATPYALAFAAANQLLNAALENSPRGEQLVRDFGSNVLRVSSFLPPLTFDITCRENRILLTPQSPSASTAHLRGSLPDLLALITGEHNAYNSASISGDRIFVEHLLQHCRGLDIDWAYLISRLIGDLPAQALVETVQHLSALRGQLFTATLHGLSLKTRPTPSHRQTWSSTAEGDDAVAT